MSKAVYLVKPYQPTLDERNHESLMRALVARINEISDPAEKRRLWAEYTRLHEQRSPEMIAHLERERGLR